MTGRSIVGAGAFGLLLAAGLIILALTAPVWALRVAALLAVAAALFAALTAVGMYRAVRR